MEYIRTQASGQLVFEKATDYLCIPSCLYGFKNERTTVGGKMILPPHGKEFFHSTVSSFLHPAVSTFLHVR